jgi:hypothetical protein
MDARAAFLFSYAGMTTGVLGSQPLLEHLTDDQLRTCPDPRMNPIIWPLWHIVRCEDITVNRIVADSPQVFDAEDWSARTRVPWRDIGARMTDEEVAAFSAEIDLAAFRAYRTAVIERTLAAAESLAPEVWDEPVRLAQLLRVVMEDKMLRFRPRDAWLQERSKGSWMFSHVITHGYRHLGEAYTIRGMLGLPQIA